MVSKEATEVGFVYVGTAVGVGFSTGQEATQFFTKYGSWAYLGVTASGPILAFIGCQVAKIGTAFEVTNHKSILQYVFSERFSKVFDYILISFLFGIAITVITGVGTTFEKSYSTPTWLDVLIMTLAIYIALLLDFSKIVRALGIVTSFPIVLVVSIAGAYLLKGHISSAEINRVVPEVSIQKGVWFGTIHGGLAFSIGFSTIVVIGGDIEKRIVPGAGAMYGGIIYAVLLALINFILQGKYPAIKDASIPTLALANNIHPLMATVLSVIMLVVMHNITLGLMYSFTARLTELYSKNYHIFIIIMMVAGYLLSFVEFAELTNKLYTIMGYIGLFIVVAATIGYFRRKNTDKKHIA